MQQARSFTATGTLHRTAATSIPRRFFSCLRPATSTGSPNSPGSSAARDHHPYRLLRSRRQSFTAIAPAAGLLAILSAERRIRFIHLSTDQVFDGTAAPYTETSAPMSNSSLRHSQSPSGRLRSFAQPTGHHRSNLITLRSSYTRSTNHSFNQRNLHRRTRATVPG